MLFFHASIMFDTLLHEESKNEILLSRYEREAYEKNRERYDICTDLEKKSSLAEKYLVIL